jgi:hypothetical protein
MTKHNFKLIGIGASVIVSTLFFLAFNHNTKIQSTHQFAFKTGIDLVSSLSQEQQSLEKFIQSSNFDTLPFNNQAKLKQRFTTLNQVIPELKLATQQEELLRSQGKTKQADELMVAISEYDQAYRIKDMDKKALSIMSFHSFNLKDINSMQKRENHIFQEISTTLKNLRSNNINNTNNTNNKL